MRVGNAEPGNAEAVMRLEGTPGKTVWTLSGA